MDVYYHDGLPSDVYDYVLVQDFIGMVIKEEDDNKIQDNIRIN